MKCMLRVPLCTVALACALMATPARAQETRAENLALERAAKSEDTAAAPAPHPGLMEQSLAWAKTRLDLFGNANDGFYMRIGGMIPGSGWLSLGPGYRRHIFNGAAVLDSSAVISLRRYSAVQTRVGWPNLFSKRLSIETAIKYQDFPEINYFGVGADSSRDAQTDFRLKNLETSGAATWHLPGGLSAGGSVGYVTGFQIQRGLSTFHQPVQNRFDNTTAPGLIAQPRYLHTELFIQGDSQDSPTYPTAGGLYRASFTVFDDLNRTGHRFQRFDADATRYIPVFHKNWIFVLGSRVVLSRPVAADEVPFYLMPALGGHSSLRGYADYRFRDRNAALISGEYRWPLFRMMDAALFADAGTVAATAGALWTRAPAHDFGFGLRLHSTTASLINVDVARGREGTRIAVGVSTFIRGRFRSAVPFVW